MTDVAIRDLTLGGAFLTMHNGRERWIAHASYTDDRGKRRFIRGIAATERDAKRRLAVNMSKRLANPTRVSPSLRTLFDNWIESYGPCAACDMNPAVAAAPRFVPLALSSRSHRTRFDRITHLPSSPHPACMLAV